MGFVRHIIEVEYLAVKDGTMRTPLLVIPGKPHNLLRPVVHVGFVRCTIGDGDRFLFDHERYTFQCLFGFRVYQFGSNNRLCEELPASVKIILM